MEILSLAYKKRAKFLGNSATNKSILHVFIGPAWAGNHIVEAEIHIQHNDLLDFLYMLEISQSYEEAHKKAHLSQMSEDDYKILFGK